MSETLNSAILTLHNNLKSLRSFVGLVHPYLKEQAVKRAKDNAQNLIPFMMAMKELDAKQLGDEENLPKSSVRN